MLDDSIRNSATSLADKRGHGLVTFAVWSALATAPGCRCNSDTTPRKPAAEATAAPLATDPATAADTPPAATATTAAAARAATTTDDDEMNADQIQKALTIDRAEFLPMPPVGIDDADLLLERCLGDLRNRTASFGPWDAARVELGAEPRPSPAPGPQLPWIAKVDDTGISWDAVADGHGFRMGKTSWLIAGVGEGYPIDDDHADVLDLRSALLLLRRGLRAGDHILRLATVSEGPEAARDAPRAVALRLARANMTVQIVCSDAGAIVGLRQGEKTLTAESDGSWTEISDGARTRWSRLERPGRWTLATRWQPTLDLKTVDEVAKAVEQMQERSGRPCLRQAFAALRRKGDDLSSGGWCPIGVRPATADETARPAIAIFGPLRREEASVRAFAAQLVGDGAWRLASWQREANDATTATALLLSAADAEGATP